MSEPSTRIRPAQVLLKARGEYEKTYHDQLAKHPGKIAKAVKAAMKTYDKVLKDYDRKTKNSSDT